MQYFASFEPFEVFEEFNGVPGTYIKSFLISDKVNLNLWQATHEANVAYIDTFLGRPGIHYINPENGKRDHTGATSFQKSLQIQELYRAANIIAVGSDLATKKNWQVSKMVDPEVTQLIKDGIIKFISPSLWPKDGAVRRMEQTDGSVIDVVDAYDGLHYAFVDEPAYGDEAEIKGFCDGTTKACQDELSKFTASLDNVGPITEHEIKVPDKEKEKKKKKDSSKDAQNISYKNSSDNPNQQMATEEELQKKLEQAKATEEDLKKELEGLKSKVAQMEEDEKEGKKGTEDNDKKDDEKEAKIAALEAMVKGPLVEKIVNAQLSASVITKDQVPEATSKLMKASINELNTQYEVIRPFEAKIKSFDASLGDAPTIPYMGSVNTSDGGYDASVADDMDYDKLMEVSN